MYSQGDPHLTITEIARRSGVNASALRFYESRGLINSARSGSGHRRYPRSVLRRVAYIVFAQRVGFSLEEISEQLDGLPNNHAPMGEDWQRLSATWKARVQQRIAELERLNMSLEECIGCGCMSMDHCKMNNPGDIYSRNGCGARRWIGDEKIDVEELRGEA
ncbi:MULTISPECIES: redox-sensitive transcriptional activator SoxR [Pseudomonas]|uniref:Redox-sensitive transcriptional activator SoxR n=1 Tax=Pseudomonas piscis TaxID=2614538 RepID=U7A5Z6_9PSED|nr:MULTISPECIES: redox-sensitive transcriptional activator SoxR [Pseudomonas]AZC16217.1 Redox-sensitive transcriptional activator SoxR [Pseudomonas sp. CMR5c]ERO65886.1 MerR family transcriptional regulator [Pseudomonas piscis]MQA57710.1 redox-sensitive transcriptional activator SoxR [Pseudomonas piscis]POA53581.1 redox-sensitive transcriptional activator SoxR [Pseudomonas sp. FW507-12TSA]WMN18569.1 redox-sensitive transcriptional activator SoxR [Pseudomonas piscis]